MLKDILILLKILFVLGLKLMSCIEICQHFCPIIICLNTCGDHSAILDFLFLLVFLLLNCNINNDEMIFYKMKCETKERYTMFVNKPISVGIDVNEL